MSTENEGIDAEESTEKHQTEAQQCPICRDDVALEIEADTCYSIGVPAPDRVCIDSHGVTATVYLHWSEGE